MISHADFWLSPLLSILVLLVLLLLAVRVAGA